ncbi:putative ciliary rootlet coiled-coil protein 2 [Manis javanica]|nr:putative ciliary rootlet coiled-coil protein 2 [Manis javanica]
MDGRPRAPSVHAAAFGLEQGAGRHVIGLSEDTAEVREAGEATGQRHIGHARALSARTAAQQGLPNIAQSFRPGHADYAYFQKYGIRDPGRRRPFLGTADGPHGGRWCRGQEVAQRKFGTEFRACMTQVGELVAALESWEHVRNNPFFAPVADVSQYEEYMDALRKSGDSCGAALRVQASGMPVGLGQPLYDRLDADVAYAMMGLNAVKAVEIGAGFESVVQRGTTHGDSLSPQGFRSNNAGGIVGGISTGQDLKCA